MITLPTPALESCMSRHRGISACEIDSVAAALRSWPFPDRAVEQPAAAFVPPPPVDFNSITLFQQYALISMTENHVRRSLQNKMLDGYQTKPTWQDYRALVERGWAIRRKSDGFHNPSPEGRRVAALLTRELCLKLDVHLLDKTSDDRWQSNYRCPCGFMGSVRRSTTSPGNINRAHFAYAEFEQRKLVERKAEAS